MWRERRRLRRIAETRRAEQDAQDFGKTSRQQAKDVKDQRLYVGASLATPSASPSTPRHEIPSDEWSEALDRHLAFIDDVPQSEVNDLLREYELSRSHPLPVTGLGIPRDVYNEVLFKAKTKKNTQNKRTQPEAKIFLSHFTKHPPAKQRQIIKTSTTTCLSATHKATSAPKTATTNFPVKPIRLKELH